MMSSEWATFQHHIKASPGHRHVAVVDIAEDGTASPEHANMKRLYDIHPQYIPYIAKVVHRADGTWTKTEFRGPRTAGALMQFAR